MPDISDNAAPLSADEYERIFQVIHAVLDTRADTPHACWFFAIAGSFILNKYHEIPASPVAGAFVICVDDAPSLISIGKNEGRKISWDKDNFHMWIQTKSHAIDFMAPIFRESVQSRIDVPRRMFQRLLNSESRSLDDISMPGEFYTMPDSDLTENFIEDFMERAGKVDLLRAIDAWYKRYPEPLKEMALLDNHGKIEPLKIVAPPVQGAW
ncbi:DUF2026 family protein [Xanthomonas oryzae]|uniref:DUF2026 family protein n=1 Tax=Xanthomonas oryzae TaxID=347 RepID=UPI000A602A6E|nr:DUF2026 family protein [Xanthomonas oryzae]QIE16743.1 DUF2026 domain-containing protein [Xanthomonas oryzae pv. oryzae]UXV98499.1 DUF2026 domain-containing protein [Xanthomonas oryzae pv. oryzae]UZK19559.1 DUF2026 family protein [Xanthomonas oryzae pv. oryzae]